jgi:predicted MFS family arabinose efflux permease
MDIFLSRAVHQNLHFVSECFGVAIVGPIIIVYGTVAGILNFITGRISVYTTRTALAIFAGSLQVAVVLFLMIWEREASYYVVFAIAVAQGLIRGILLPLPSMCAAIISLQEECETAFSMVRGFYGIGAVISVVVSSFSSLGANLGVMLVILLLGLLMYITTERMMGCDPCRLTKLPSAIYQVHRQRKDRVQLTQ